MTEQEQNQNNQVEVFDGANSLAISEAVQDYLSNGFSQEEAEICYELEGKVLYWKSQAGRSIVEIGRSLIRAKEEITTGSWTYFVENRLNFGDRAARYYMAVGRLVENYPTLEGLISGIPLREIAEVASSKLMNEHGDAIAAELVRVVEEGLPASEALKPFKEPKPPTPEKEFTLLPPKEAEKFVDLLRSFGNRAFSRYSKSDAFAEIRKSKEFKAYVTKALFDGDELHNNVLNTLAVAFWSEQSLVGLEEDGEE